MTGGTGVAVVILAAGTSSRLGRPKQLLELGGEPLLRHTVRHALASRADEVLLVLGSEAATIREAVGVLGQRTVVNRDFAAGQSTSLIAGLRAVNEAASAVIFMLGDQPTVGPDVLDALIARFTETGAVIVQPMYLDGPGNPILFGRRLFPELMAVEGDHGAREVLRRHREDVVRITMPQQIPPDVDTEQAFEQLRTRWESGGQSGE